MRPIHQLSKALATAFVLATASTAFAADDGAWTVSKSSGEVWLSSAGAQPASLKQEETLKPGDTVRTGRNGRVLLKRGEETMLISPNSVVGMPTEKKDGMSTTIIQQAGSILLEVEKRNVKHFEVETPYLAAVVKGTQFSVTIKDGSTSVGVTRGQVEVSDFRSGQIAQVMPGQHATTFTEGKGGLKLGGTGTFNPIEQGKPRTTTVEPIHVPRGGLSAPTRAGLSSPGSTAAKSNVQPSQHANVHAARPGVTRISASMGEVHLNFHRVTHGLARDTSAANGGNRNASNGNSASTVWDSSGSSSSSSVASNSQGSNGNTSNSSSNSNSSASNSGGNGGSGAAGSSGTAAASGGTGAVGGVVAGVVTTVAAVTGGNNGNSKNVGNGAANGNGFGNGVANGVGNGLGKALGHLK